MMDEIKPITLREHFSKRPSMYIGKACMASFMPWLLGIRIAEDTHRIKDEDRIFPHLNGFEEHLSKKRGYSGSVKSYGFARKKAKDDDVEAFHLWMKWYDEYTKKLPIAEPGI